MTDSDQQRFNLVFSGQLLPGTDDKRAKHTLAAFFGLRDISGVDVFFSGKPVPLRRNITRNDAQRLYQQLRSVGLICELSPTDKPAPAAKAKTSPLTSGQPVSGKAFIGTDRLTSAKVRPRGKSHQSASQPQGKAPNLFALRPASVPLNPARLLESTQIRGLIFTATAVALCALILAVVLRFPAASPEKAPLGPLAGTALLNDQLVLLVADALLVHERSGLPSERISASDLGFHRLAPPLWQMNDGDLLFNAAKDGSAPRLQRCNLQELHCYTFSPEVLKSPIVAIAGSFLGNSIFLLSENGQLWRSNSAGELEASATVQVPWGQARVLAANGLLLVPAGDAPMLGVYRPDQQNFGQQLDALLVMPPGAIAAGKDRLQDVALGEAHHWSLMAGDGASAELYQLDLQWGNPAPVSLAGELFEPFFISWRDKLLIADSRQALIQRVASNGTVEAPLKSQLLLQERENWLRLEQQRTLLRQWGIGLPLLLVLLCSTAALLYLASYRHLAGAPQTRSALLDPLPAGVEWVPGSTAKMQAIAQLAAGLLLCSILLLIVVASLGGWLRALAVLPLLGACLYGWRELRRGSGGHLGLLNKHFIAVDYDGRYFYGERALLRGSAAIILAPGVVLPVSLPGLPNLSLKGIAAARYAAAHKSSYTEILGAFWLSGHPWLHAALAVLTGLILCICLLVIIG